MFQPFVFASTPADGAVLDRTAQIGGGLLPSGPPSLSHGRAAQPVDEPQDRGEQRLRHRYFGELEDDVAAVAPSAAPAMTHTGWAVSKTGGYRWRSRRS